MKPVSSDIGKNLKFYLPLIEEITTFGAMPMCVVGIKFEEESKKIEAYFATHNKTMDAMLYDICKAFVSGYEKGQITQI